MGLLSDDAEIALRELAANTQRIADGIETMIEMARESANQDVGEQMRKATEAIREQHPVVAAAMDAMAKKMKLEAGEDPE